MLSEKSLNAKKVLTQLPLIQKKSFIFCFSSHLQQGLPRKDIALFNFLNRIIFCTFLYKI